MYAATVLAVNFSVADSVIHFKNNSFTSTGLAIFYILVDMIKDCPAR